MITPESKINLEKVKEKVNMYDLAHHFEEVHIALNYNNVKFLCPWHEERTPSCTYNLDKNFGWCFGCSKSWDIFDYVQKKLDCSFKAALDFLLKFSNLSPDSLLGEYKKEDYRSQLRAINKTKQKASNFTTFNEQDIEFMKLSRGSWFKDRGFTDETLDFFEVGFYDQENRVVVPIRNEINELIGVTGRIIYKDFKERGEPKWKHYFGSSVSHSFFNIKNAIEASKDEENSVIIVEGPSDAMWLHQNGFKNVISCLTNRVSGPQKGIILKNFMSAILFLDADSGGDNGVSSIKKELKEYIPLYNISGEQGKDPDNYSKEELTELINNAKKV